MDTKVTAVAPFVREPKAGTTVNVLGVTHIYKATAAETGGAFSLWEAVVPPGHGAPPHTHAREDESFYVLSGELLIECESEVVPHRLGPGGFFFGARGWRHSFRNVGGQPARVLILSAPGRGLDRMFVELEAAADAGMPDMGRLASITGKYGVTLEPPAP
jgi:mannose-6-phosphate isomerase-like protein (cupin superfamily)